MTEWPADKVERRKVADLIPYVRNSRTHSPEHVAQIAASIREWGFTVPILIDPQGGLIAGHGRLLAAQKLGLDEVPCMVADGWTETQKRAYVIADNRLAENSGWDLDMLAAELEELRLDDFSIDLVGFDQAALDEMFDGFGEEEGTEGLTEPDETRTLADRFGVPPFSVLNAREGWWQERKRAWLALGIKSELGRGDQLIPNGGGQQAANATPGGSLMPAADYSKNRKRGNGRGQAIG